MQRSSALALLLMLGLAAPAHATVPTRGLGMVVGSLSGTGLGYRETYRNGLGWSVGGGAAYVQPANQMYDLALSASYTVAELEWGRVYLLAGMAGYYMGSQLDLMPGAGIGILMGGAEGINLALDMPVVLNRGSLVPIPALSLYYNWSKGEPEPIVAPQAAPEPTASPEPEFTSPRGRSGLGFAAGGQGIGGTYRYWGPDGWGFGIAGVVLGSGGSLFTSIGGGVHRLVSETSSSRFFLTGGGQVTAMGSSTTPVFGLGYGLELGGRQGINVVLDGMMVSAGSGPTVTYMPLPDLGLIFYF